MKQVARLGASGAVPPPLPPGVGQVARGVASANEHPVEAIEDGPERTEKWVVPPDDEDLAAQKTPIPISAPPPPKHAGVTVASRIPAMLAESMALAGDDESEPPKR
jgi:hypothetical protein